MKNNIPQKHKELNCFWYYCKYTAHKDFSSRESVNVVIPEEIKHDGMKDSVESDDLRERIEEEW